MWNHPRGGILAIWVVNIFILLGIVDVDPACHSIFRHGINDQNNNFIFNVPIANNKLAVLVFGRSDLNASYIGIFERVKGWLVINVHPLGKSHFGRCTVNVDLPLGIGRRVLVLHQPPQRRDASHIANQPGNHQLRFG